MLNIASFNKIFHVSCVIIKEAILPCKNVRFFATSLRTSSAQIESHPENNHDKILNVAIIGSPNAGKSTLINNLVERRVCPASNKVHTTKTLAKAILNEDNTQIVFLDTPGIVTDREQKKYKLQAMTVESYKGLNKADIVGVIQDASNPWTRESLHPSIITLLNRHRDIPSFLIINKIDLMKSKRKLLDLIRMLSNGIIAGRKMLVEDKEATRKRRPKPEQGYDGFSDVFMVSALEGDGVDKIKNYLIENAKPGKWAFPEMEWSDQTQETLIVDTVRAKFLDFLSQEIPYRLFTEIEYLEHKKEPNRMVCLVVVTCPTQRIEMLIAGAGGGKLKQITDAARYDLVQMFHKSVSLTISLRTNPKNIDI